MISYYVILGKCLLFRLLQLIKVGVKPATLSLFTGTLSDMARSRTDLIVENALLRQQLIFLNRYVKRPQLTHRDRFLLILLAHCTEPWKQALHIVQPDTHLRWHRELFRFYWRRKSRHKQEIPKISPETSELIRKEAKENRLWGADRICDELLKLDIQVCKRTIQKYLLKARITPNPSQTLGHLPEESCQRHLGLRLNRCI